MVKRLLSASTSEVMQFNGQELKESIKASEGRIIVSENIVTQENLDSITTAEIAAAFGADMILCNRLDVYNPKIFGLYPGERDLYSAPKHDGKASIARLQKLVGRPIGINVEPIGDHPNMMENQISILPGCTASEAVIKKAEEMGFQFMVLTGNPGTGVTNAEIAHSIALAKTYFSGLIIAGKMHASGVDEPLMSEETAKRFIDAGADVILAPAVGSIPGFDEAALKAEVQVVHRAGGLVMSAIGTSQEGSGSRVLQEMAIRNKICGVDMQHVGDSAWGFESPVDNLYAVSKAIRGERHTIQRMARSINR
ncbi:MULTISPECIES: DUF7916 family protein [Lacticaseibacillus]|uniref:Haloacid dehalogenase-like hydrolase n=1 Tax=Lacticaseibacillus huelsenbergensis TaxID=3035291 RepID=A0ABY8DTC1_9LACO|nr:MULTISPECIES: haloacid dehalogenase-like hydrolase [Lacticaseibacillus]MDG3062284.1 haloacid dehalogenase-like hydrolase [Lacticaseibacillus sp. BCRC 81376]WFB40255.1 haloacid dehalogenase-like hydrolase [Lacticaseibacillus huelsenbergensis]